ncbi:hypothetical protein J6590_014837 [Homalodisca vitripennis]|nr:hypothetical protein J6590_014837 [Homalodisca vitripennis]
MVIEENGACKYQCLSCNKVYKHKFILNRHQRYECGDRRPFRCFLCPYSAKQKKSLKIHLLTKHKDVTLPVELLGHPGVRSSDTHLSPSSRGDHILETISSASSTMPLTIYSYNNRQWKIE